MNRIAIYEMPEPESCFACLFCLPSDVRNSLFCRATDLITDDYHSSRHPDCLLKIVGGKYIEMLNEYAKQSKEAHE